MKALITGGAGFIGSHLANALSNQGHKVTILDNFSTGNRQNLHGIKAHIIKGDICDLMAVKKAITGCDIIFHHAALASVPQSVKAPQKNHDINVTGLFNILEAARQENISRIVYASSAAIYGNHPQLPKTESSPIQPPSPYAAAKYMNEIYAYTYAEEYNLTCVGLRYMNVYGPRQDPSSPYSGALSIFCQNILQEKTITVFGDGLQTRDFVFVEDVVQANILAATADLPSKSEVFNIGTGIETNLNQIIAELQQHTDHQVNINYIPPRDSDIRRSVANIDKATKVLGYKPQVPISEGLTKTLNWFRTKSN